MPQQFHQTVPESSSEDTSSDEAPSPKRAASFSEDSESDSDKEPPTKKNRTQSKTPPKVNKAPAQDDSSDDSSDEEVGKAAAFEESSDEETVKLPPKAQNEQNSFSAKNPNNGNKQQESSSEDTSSDEAPSPKRAASFSEDSESDSDKEPPTKKNRTQSKTPPKVNKAPAQDDSSDDSSDEEVGKAAAFEESSDEETVKLPPKAQNEQNSFSAKNPNNGNKQQAVTGDDVPICSGCEEGTSASSRCRDCSKLLFDPCVQAHQRVRITKDHRIVKFAKDVTNIPDSLGSVGSSQASNSRCSSGMGATTNICDLQHELYCETCLSAVCTHRTLIDHTDHQLIYIQDAIEAARASRIKLIAEARGGQAATREAIANVQRRFEAVADVRNVTNRYLVVLEECEQRECELLHHIEQMRQMKGNALHAQMAKLRVALAEQVQLSDVLNKSLEGTTVIDIIVINQLVSNELKRIRAIRLDLNPCEDDNIVSVPPDSSLMVQLRLKELQIFSLPFLPPVELKDQPELQVGCGPRGRPILRAPRLVIAREPSNIPIVIGSEGEGDGQLCRPWGVCCDGNGNIVVADRSNNRIQVFRPNGTFSHKFGVQGEGAGQFDRPAGVAVDPLGLIVVADKHNHRIQILTLAGTFVLMFGEKGCRNGQFNYPSDVAVNCQGNIVVSDTWNHRIQVFSNDGKFINKYGFEGMTPMWKPRGVCFTPTGSVIVTDCNNNRIVIIDHRFAQSQFLGNADSGRKQFLRPQGIVCDDEGRIIVADSRNNRIQVFESNGTFLWKLGQQGKGPGELDRPSGICLNPEGRIVVVDFGNDRVQIF